MKVSFWVIAIEIFICTLVLAFCSSSENEKKRLVSSFTGDRIGYSTDAQTLHFEAKEWKTSLNSDCVKKRLADKCFPNDHTPLIYGNVECRFVNYKKIKLSDNTRDVNGIPFITPIKRMQKWLPENIQNKILDNWFEKDSIVLTNDEANEVAKSMYSLEEPYLDTVVISFVKENKELSEKKARNGLGEFSLCKIKEKMSFELQYLGNGIAYFYIQMFGSPFIMKKITIVDLWKNDYIPIVELCNDCELKKIDSNRYEISGILEMSKARGDLLFNDILFPKLQFYAFPLDSAIVPNLDEKKSLYTLNIDRDVCDLTEKQCVHMGKEKCDSLLLFVRAMPYCRPKILLDK